MTQPSPVEKILAMVQAGRISKEEGDELLAALRSVPHPFTRLLFTPFERLGLGLSFAIGAAVAVASLALVFLRVHFDGPLDVHIVDKPILFTRVLVEQLVDWPMLALMLWLGAYLTRQRGRLIDFLAHTGVARTPMLVAGLLGWVIFEGLTRLGPPAQMEARAQLAAIGVAILCQAWFVALLYHGHRTATGARGTRMTITFVVALVLAEVVGEVIQAAVPLHG